MKFLIKYIPSLFLVEEFDQKIRIRNLGIAWHKLITGIYTMVLIRRDSSFFCHVNEARLFVSRSL